MSNKDLITDKQFNRVMLGIVFVLIPIVFGIATKSWILVLIIMITLFPFLFITSFKKSDDKKDKSS